MSERRGGKRQSPPDMIGIVPKLMSLEVDKEINMKSNKKILIAVKILSILNLYPLLPCVYMTVDDIVWHITHNHIPEPSNAFLNVFFCFADIILCFSRIFFMPYIASVTISVAYVYLLKKTGAPIREWIVFSVITIICILGLLSVEGQFWAMMGI